MLPEIDALSALVSRYPVLVVLTGAGVSAESGIPTYRDDAGAWRGRTPVQHQDFVRRESSRRRYWMRSMMGWRRVAEARPNLAHRALADLERSGHVPLLVTQNVDRLHQRAGHRQVVDLHGRLDRVVCLRCGRRVSRARLQAELEALNPGFGGAGVAARPDGDAEVTSDESDIARFRVPACARCGGTLMPDVVFFGGQVPRARVAAIRRAIERAHALLVAGSSLAVYSGFRFCRFAVDRGRPLLIVNRGLTRADDLATLKIESSCGEVLRALADRVGATSSPRSS